MYRPFKESTILRTDTPINQTLHLEESNKIQGWEATKSPEYWDYRGNWIKFPQERIVGSFPLHLDIEATNACNLRCVMCPRTIKVADGTFWDIGMFDFDLYKQIIDEGVENGLCSVKFNYLGEPLLNPRLAEMIKYAKQAGVLDTMLNTNATLLVDWKARELIEAGLDKLFVSFDSPYRDKYNQIRVRSEYDMVLANIREFNEIRKEMGSVSPLTRVSMVRMEENKDDWEVFCKLFEPIVDVVAYIDYLDHFGQNKPEYSPTHNNRRNPNFCCASLWQRMFIHPDGVVTVCCLDSMRSLQVGNAFEQSVHDIWTGEKIQELRDLHANGRYEEIPACAVCPLSRYLEDNGY